MKSTIKLDTGLGRRPARKARRIARSFAARKAAGRRPDEQAERDAWLRRHNFLITHGERWRGWYGPACFGSQLTRRYTIADAVAGVVRKFDLPILDDAAIESGVCVEEGFAGEDVAIWRDGRLLAVVRRGAGGKPEAICFDDNADNAIEWRVMTSHRPPGRRGPEAFDPIKAKLRDLKRQIGAIDRRHDERSGA